MSELFQNILTASFHGSIVIAVVILLRLVLKRAPKKFICLLWLLAGIRLLMPFEIKSDLSLQPDVPTVEAQWQEPAGPEFVPVMEPDVIEDAPAAEDMPVFNSPVQEAEPVEDVVSVVQTPAPQTQTVTVEEKEPFDWMTVVPYIWLTVACGFGVYSLISYLSLKRKVRFSVKIPGGWECDRIDTAFILGFIKPKIYIPMGMSPTVRRHILAHERTHLDKGDHWFKMIGFLALALHWFNPLVWVAYILLCKDIEMACDERVVQFMELEERKEYSAALLSCSTNRAHFAACPVAFGEVSVKERIKSVLSYKKPGFWISLVGIIAIIFVAVCLVTSPAEEGGAAAGETTFANLTEEEKKIQACADQLNALLSQDSYALELYANGEDGYMVWTTDLFKLGGSTMWTHMPSSSAYTTSGRLEYEGGHYVYQNGSWIATDTEDAEFEAWLDLLRWDMDTAKFVEETEQENGRTVVFTAQYQNDEKAIYTATMKYFYDTAGDLASIRVENANHETAATVFLTTKWSPLEEKTVDEYFAEASANIAEGMVTAEQLAEQAEFDEWGVFFRVDDDRLSDSGSDVYISQSKYGRGVLSTTEAYWIERKNGDSWEEVTPITTPRWSDDSVGIAKEMATYGYLDWTSIYGKLPSGTYRMGKKIECYDSDSRYQGVHNFYSEFEIYSVVDSNSPEAAAAVERCYAKLEELKNRESIHWKSITGSDDYTEGWVNGEDYLQVRHWGLPDRTSEEDLTEHERSLFPRTDTYVRYNGVGYKTVREDPDVLTSEVVGMGLSTLLPNRAGWVFSLAEDFNILFFERGNHQISFPQGVGVISDEMVRFQESWSVAGWDEKATAQLTFRFDSAGNLVYMEYLPTYDENAQAYSIEIYDTTAAEIDAKIRPYTQNLIVGTFSWAEAKVKYNDADFNIREDSFVNNEPTTISGPVEAARRALLEYPNLGEYLSIDVYRDEAAGMWKVTIRSYVDYQATYGYRDIYMDDNGVTFLLVYEGPIRYDESRK